METQMMMAFQMTKITTTIMTESPIGKTETMMAMAFLTINKMKRNKRNTSMLAATATVIAIVEEADDLIRIDLSI
jgi:hypothetical protein